VAVLPPASATAEEILQALDIKDYRAVLLIIGGADNLDEKQKSQLIQLFGRGIARAALNANAVIIDGATESGVMAMMGQGVTDRGYKSSLVGVARREGAGILLAWNDTQETPGHHAIIGPAPNVAGLYFVNGFSGHGVMHSPASGRITVDLILHGRSDLITAQLTVQRFAAGQLLEERAVL
jgi:hypothetical protein